MLINEQIDNRSVIFRSFCSKGVQHRLLNCGTARNNVNNVVDHKLIAFEVTLKIGDTNLHLNDTTMRVSTLEI
ncbi:hypothetical protein BLOT_013630 [Blomia tropicalis]|nr:hypothetical protein BLOT_013630 [Blomia tropicalis]